MITKIEISGFKSFHNFEMELSPLTVIAGTNASGKSNLFDALHLLSNLAKKELHLAFSSQQLRGELPELFTKYSDDESAAEIRMAVELLVPRHVADSWGGEASISTPRLRYEIAIGRKQNEQGVEVLYVKHEQLSRIRTEDDAWAKKYMKRQKYLWQSTKKGGSGEPYIKTETEKGHPTITIRQDGGHGRGRSVRADAINQTVLRGVNSVDFPHVLAVQQEIASWNFMQLNPELLREPTRYDAHYTGDTIGHAGENLAAALYRLSNQNPYILDQVIMKLSSFITGYTSLDVNNDTANKRYIFNLRNSDGKVFSSRVLSEGTLRLLVLCVLMYDDKFQGLLCFEEPENGIHPYRLKAMANLLRLLTSNFDDDDDALRQVIVNTHSPELLKCIKDLYANNPGVSIWFSKLISTSTEVDGRRHVMRITRISPLTLSFQETFSFAENQMTYADALRFLNEAPENY